MTDKKVAYLYLLITFCAWGSYYTVSKFLLGKVPPLTILFLRYLIAGIALFIILRKRKMKEIAREDYKYIFLIGFAGYFLSSTSQLFGAKLANASLASMINSMNPVATAVFSSIILKEKLTVKKIVCICLAVSGVYTIIGGVSDSGQVVGVMLSVFALIVWSFTSVVTRRLTQKYDALKLTTYGVLITAVCTLPFSIFELVTIPNVKLDWAAFLSLVYVGLACTSVAYVLWNKSLSILEASSCSLFYPIQPMVSILLGSIFLGERLNINFVFGAILIIGGVLYSILGRNEAVNRSTLKDYKQKKSISGDAL